MSVKRMRVFAGPNGSGKTTIIKSLHNQIPFGVYVNADDIEESLSQGGINFLDKFKLNITQECIQSFFKASLFAPVKRNELDLWTKITVVENVLYIKTKIDSYLAADIAEFIRQSLLENGLSFTYETVMSHEGKIDFLQKARDKNYRVYLYFIATEDPEINIRRVNVRVALNGHYVPAELIRNRYFKTLRNLKEAVKKSNRAYIWDNSATASILISEITNGIDVKIIDTDKVPNWFLKYLVE